jgi:hypothetical protein
MTLMAKTPSLAGTVDKGRKDHQFTRLSVAASFTASTREKLGELGIEPCFDSLTWRLALHASAVWREESYREDGNGKVLPEDFLICFSVSPRVSMPFLFCAAVTRKIQHDVGSGLLTR